MSMRITPEAQEQKVLANMRLVYYVINQFPHINPNDYEDWVQIGRIGLIKAVSTFDENKGKKFSPYAVRCIKNEIYMNFRKERKHSSNISLNDVIHTSEKGADCELESILGDAKNFVEHIEDDEIITNAVTIILNILPPNEAIAMLYKISGMYIQRDIAKALEVSQSYVSRLTAGAARKIKKCLEKKEKPDSPVFSMMKKGDFYCLKCNTQYHNKQLAEFLRSEKAKILPGYKVMGDDNSIELWMPSCSEIFVFVAEFIKKTANL